MNGIRSPEKSAIDLVDPELRRGIELIPDIQLCAAQLGAFRALSAAPNDRREIPGMVEHRLAIDTPDGGVGIIVCRPEGSAILPGVCCLHGGGFVAGSAEAMAAQRRESVIDLNVVLVFVDYRLAPEHPFPGPLEDCYHALRWMFTAGAAFGIDRTHIAVSGISAGGGLAAALSILARDRGEVSIAFQHLLSPMLDDRTVNDADPHSYVGEFIWTRESNRFGWQSYLGCEPGGADISPYAAPARLEDMTGLPPTYLAVGALDLFLEEDLDYARRLTRAGVPCELHVYPGVYHGAAMIPEAEISKRWEVDSRDALKRGCYRT